MRTASQFREWLARAKPGARVTYYQGYLATETDTTTIWLGAYAYDMYLGGKVHLIQKRLGNGCYNYIAEKRSATTNRPSKN